MSTTAVTSSPYATHDNYFDRAFENYLQSGYAPVGEIEMFQEETGIAKTERLFAFAKACEKKGLDEQIGSPPCLLFPSGPGSLRSDILLLLKHMGSICR